MIDFSWLKDPATTNTLTLGLVILTGLYCLLTYKIARENQRMAAQMKRQLEITTAPDVVVNTNIRHQNVLGLRIKNVGHSSANNLQLRINKDFHQFASTSGERNLRGIDLFQRTIPCFPPNEEIYVDLTQGWNLNKEHDGKLITPAQFTILVEYQHSGNTHKRQFEFDFQNYFHTRQDRPEVWDEIEKIRIALEKISKKY